MIDRRGAIAGALALSFAGPAAMAATSTKGRYGLVGRMVAKPGQRDALVALLLQGSGGGMPGCLNYVVAEDVNEADVVWVTEVWESEMAHHASLALPQVVAAIAQAVPLIQDFKPGTTTRVVGGIGINKAI